MSARRRLLATPPTEKAGRRRSCRATTVAGKAARTAASCVATLPPGLSDGVLPEGAPRVRGVASAVSAACDSAAWRSAALRRSRAAAM